MIIEVVAKPNSKFENIKMLSPTKFQISVKEPPVKGMANNAIIKIVADYFKVSVDKVKIIRGATFHKKIIQVQ